MFEFETKYLFYASFPLVAAVIGWFTNYLAVKMLFRPRKAFSLLGLKIHGLIPRRQHDLAESIGETVEKELVSHDDIQKALKSPEVSKRIHYLLQEQVQKFLQEKLAQNPMIAMFLAGEGGAAISQMLVEQFETSIPGILDDLMGHVENEIDFRELVKEKIEAFELSKLEAIIYRIASKELKMIEVLGAVLGFFVGCVQLIILLMRDEGVSIF